MHFPQKYLQFMISDVKWMQKRTNYTFDSFSFIIFVMYKDQGQCQKKKTDGKICSSIITLIFNQYTSYLVVVFYVQCLTVNNIMILYWLSLCCILYECMTNLIT